MGRLALVLAAAALLLAGAAGSAAPEPVETRAAAILELQAAIEDERRAIELLKRTPPRLQTARDRIGRSSERLVGIYGYLSATPGASAAERLISSAVSNDQFAVEFIRFEKPFMARRSAIRSLEYALDNKLKVLPVVRTAKPAAAVAQCSDGKDNDGDGIIDSKLDPGCTSPRDVRENSPFSCWIKSAFIDGRLALSGSCSGPYSGIEFRLLDGVQLNGRYDIKHAPACGAPTSTGVRCKTKEGDKNPEHLIDARFSTTSKDPSQRAELRFFDIRNRGIGRFVVPSIVPQAP